jgi:hypothetical protein
MTSRPGTIALAIFRLRFWSEELATTAAFAAGLGTTHRALHFEGARLGRKPKATSGEAPDRKKEAELYLEEREEHPTQESGSSNRQLSTTFIPPLT